MACIKSHDAALDRSPKHGVAPDKTPSPDMYKTAHTFVHVCGISEIAHLEFHKERDKSNTKSSMLTKQLLSTIMKGEIRQQNLWFMKRNETHTGLGSNWTVPKFDLLVRKL